MPLVRVTIEVYPEDTQEGLIKAEYEEVLGKKYKGKPDSLGGAVIHAYEQAMKVVRRGLWDKYPAKKEKAVEGCYYVAYPIHRSATQVLQSVANAVDVLSSIWVLNNSPLAIIVLGPIPDPTIQTDFEGRILQGFSARLKPYKAETGQEAEQLAYQSIINPPSLQTQTQPGQQTAQSEAEQKDPPPHESTPQT